MTEDRRYTDDEVAAILERAATDDRAPGSAALAPAEDAGLTLAELQDIGAEVGIAPERIAAAARSVTAAPAIPARTASFLGAPRSVERVVSIDRAMTDEEWEYLVADLRRTFSAKGRIDTHGNLRVWSNGNLQVHVEPTAEAYQVRMRTLKGNTAQLATMGIAFLFMGLIGVIATIAPTWNLGELLISLMFAAGGLGSLIYVRTSLPAWAAERAAQMEGLAERIPLLMSEEDEIAEGGAPGT
ncbi:MAG: hypothetical protein MJB57_11730 [Gemmatimonadetes bacterium]|nr:hypothetical protein [Gemmatimonadota bacterium]